MGHEFEGIVIVVATVLLLTAVDGQPVGIARTAGGAAGLGGCITKFKISGFTVDSGSAEFSGSHSIVFKLTDGTEIKRNILGPIHRNQPFEKEFSAGDSCVGVYDIAEVYLKAGENDGWYIQEIYTYCKVVDNPNYLPLNADPLLYDWLDGDQFDIHNTVLYLKHSFTVGSLGSGVDSSGCITGFKISGFTGNLVSAGFDERNTHTIVIELVNGTEIMRDIPGPIHLNRPFKWEFSPGETCVGLNDITRVYLKAGGNDGWYIREVYTYCKVEESGLYIPLTAEPTLYKWLDGDQFDEQHHEVLPLNHSFIVGSVGLIGLGDCIKGFKITGFTGDGSSSSRHSVVFKLTDGTDIKGYIPGPIHHNEPFEWEFTVANETCIRRSNIRQVYLKEGGNDGWYIREVYTYCKVENNPNYLPLNAEPILYNWLDGDRHIHNRVIYLKHSFALGSVGVGSVGPPGPQGPAGPTGHVGPVGQVGPVGPGVEELDVRLETLESRIDTTLNETIDSMELLLLVSLNANATNLDSIIEDIAYLQRQINLLNPHETIPRKPEGSCADILSSNPSSQSGYYWIEADSTGQTLNRVYCDMTLSCGGVTGGWMSVAKLDMTNSSHQCPSGLMQRTELDSGKHSCGINSNSATCSSVTYPVKKLEYSKVCGKIIAYQVGSPDTFRNSTSTNTSINTYYVDGVSLTHGNPRHHIWTFAAGLDEYAATSPQSNCPCTDTLRSNEATPPPSFIGNDYFCDTGSAGRYKSGRFYGEDPLWDGAGCGPQNTCCSFNNPPWFYKQLPQHTTDDIEMRVCRDQPYEKEDIAIEMIDIFVQ